MTCHGVNMARPHHDLPFKPRFVPRNPGAEVERRTVFLPFYPRKEPLDLNDDKVVFGAMQLVLGLWRARTAEWRKLGWSRAATQPGKVRNCFPAGVAVTEAKDVLGTVCRQRSCCPWCWGRASAELYRMLCHFLPPPRGGTLVPHDVYLVRETCRARVTDQSTGLLQLTLRGKADDMKNLLGTADALFTYRDAAVVPWQSRRTAASEKHRHKWKWKFVTTGLFVVEHGTRLPPRLAEHLNAADGWRWRVRSWPAVTHGQLKHAVIIARRYPAGLLKGPADLSYYAADVRGSRKFALYGGRLWDKL